MMLLLFAAMANPPACVEHLSLQQLQGLTADADNAFEQLDAKTFASAYDKLKDQMLCMGEILTSHSVAGFFRVRSLDAHLRRATADLLLNARAMAETGASPPPSSIAPRGHPVRNAWVRAKAQARSPTSLLPVPYGGRVLIDGRDTLHLPLERPAVLQFVGPDGQIEWTKVQEGGDPPPAYEEAPEASREQYETTIIVAAPRKPIVWAGATVGFAAAAAGTYAATFATRRNFETAQGRANIERAAQQTNTLVGISAGAAVAALGCGVVAAVKW